MARGRRGGAPKGFKFSSHPGHGSARRTAQGAKNTFKRIARHSSGGTTRSKNPR